MKKRLKDSDDDDDETSSRPYRQQAKTLGQRAADSLSNWVGSWHYIIFLIAFLFLWMIINTSLLLSDKNWDPYPYILLNLVLAAIAAIEVPVILMSQNRREQRQLAREEYDYALDKKSEREIREIRAQLNRIEKKIG